jgi:hypothetical protein
MLRRMRLPIFALAPLLALPATARAQSVQATGSGQPDRLLGGQSAPACDASYEPQGCTRPSQFNPAWVSYGDCEANLVLRFPLALSGFAAADDLQVWVSSSSGECISQASRTNGACGKIYDVGAAASAAGTINVPVWVRDVVGYTRAESACHTQLDDNPVDYYIWFLAVNTQTQAVDGTPYQYSLMTDLVGPPPPGVFSGSLQVSDGSLNLSWSPSSDVNVQGYNIYMDPAAGPQPNAPTPLSECDASASGVLSYCPEGGAAPGDVDASDDGAADGAAEGGVPADAATAEDASCTTPNPGTSSNPCQTQCSSGALISTNSFTNVTNGGGVTSVGRSFLIQSIAGSGSSSYSIGNLVDGTEYNVVISSYDSVNNVGPPTGELCDTPTTLNDFFRGYRQAGGSAGGGFCTLENAGAPVGTGVAGLAIAAAVTGAAVRKRRRRRTTSR